MATCAVCATGHSHVLAAQSSFDGCLISPEVFNTAFEQKANFSPVSDGLFERSRHFRSTGNRAVDQDLEKGLALISDNFSVRPAFGFYDPNDPKYNDGDSEKIIMNAWASEENTEIPGTTGTVAFGWDLFQDEFQKHDATGVSIMAIAAHEFAHIWQGTSGNLKRLRVGNPRKSEINADFLAGFFLGTRKLARKSLSFKAAGDLFDRLGARSEGKPWRTHGNRIERLNAAEAGFRVAYVDRRDFRYAIAAGLDYVGL